MSYMHMIKHQYINGYFEYIENLINNNENLSELFKLHKINLLSLYNYAPYLFVCATLWPNKVGTKQWENMCRVYYDLQAKGYLHYANTKNEYMDKKIEEFITKVKGDYRLSKKQLKEVIDGTIVNYIPYVELLTAAYNFDDRDFFHTDKHTYPSFAKMLNMSEDEYQIFIQQRFHTDDLPDNVLALKILRYHYDIGNACPYVDFWHYMIDADFSEVSNGSICTMYKSNILKYNLVCEGIEIPAKLFNSFRELLFKELSQFKKFKDIEQIKFEISW